MTAGDRGADNQEQIQWCLREPLEGRACRKLQGPPHRQAGGRSKAQGGPWARPMVGKQVQLGLGSILKTEMNACATGKEGWAGKRRVKGAEVCRGVCQRAELPSTGGPKPSFGGDSGIWFSLTGQ